MVNRIYKTGFYWNKNDFKTYKISRFNYVFLLFKQGMYDLVFVDTTLQADNLCFIGHNDKNAYLENDTMEC